MSFNGAHQAYNSRKVGNRTCSFSPIFTRLIAFIRSCGRRGDRITLCFFSGRSSVQLHFPDRFQSVYFLGRYRPVAVQKCINAGENQFGSFDPRHVSCTGNADQAAFR